MNSLSQKNNTFVPHAMNYFPNSSDENLYYLNNNDSQIRSGYHQRTETTNECFTYQHQEAENLSNVWTKGSFRSKKISARELNLNVKANKMSWTSQNNNNNNNNNNINVFEDDIEEEVDQQKKMTDEDVDMKSVSSPTPDSEATSPSHHARRPMNAFLIFCKKHRPVVRKKYPNLENRGVTRILGEWWALLDIADKDPYKNLAKEYKDAFFSANPDFKWYKLPAPPLRTLSTRPACTQKEHSSSPNSVNSGQYESEFTPGKLADESQLGMLSSLLNMNSYSKQANSDGEVKLNPTLSEVDSVHNNNNNNNNNITKNPSLESPPSITKITSLPPKPLKKRVFIEYKLDNKETPRDVFNVHKSNTDISRSVEDVEVNNVTKQELVDKVVDSMFFPEKNQNSSVPTRNGLKLAEKETRKSGRSCKGKLYAEFMVDGKLIKNKRDRQQRMSIGGDINTRIETELANKKIEATPKLDLGQTIKRLAERTQVSLEEVEQNLEEGMKDSRTVSESSCAKNISNKFNLELRIAELPSLNYDTYVQRKRESKKRKFTKTKSGGSSECNAKLSKTQSSNALTGDSNSKSLIGSRKRKNKLNITHLDKTQFESSFSDLSGLATLAEIAANTEKINQA